MTRAIRSARVRLLLAAACLLPAALLVARLRAATRPDRADGGALDAFDIRKEAAAQVRLPRALREVSGLAVSADGRVFSHGDERGVVYQLDYRTGAVVKAFSLGSPPVAGDFEGIAIVGPRLFLVTSTGRLYETREGADGAAVPYETYDTGLGARCELEGLAYDPTDRALVVGCKRPSARALREAVTLFRWPIDRRTGAALPDVSIPLAGVTRGTGGKAFDPAAVEREARTGHYVIVAGPQRAILEVTPAGEVVAARPLPRGLHRQPEGLAFLGDSAILIADEGGNGTGTLTLYPRAR
jgi:uncharacterized protein YjiK